MGPYRGVGRIAACFSIERTIDEIAHRVGLDPIEVRRRNVVRTYPHTTIAGLQFESGSSAETLDQMEQLLNLLQLRREHVALRKENVYRGVARAQVRSLSVNSIDCGPWRRRDRSRQGLRLAETFIFWISIFVFKSKGSNGYRYLLESHGRSQSRHWSAPTISALPRR